jgi:hypothetical protein
MNKMMKETYEWAKNDYLSHRLRFCLEMFAWFVGFCCCVTMALTVPNPPLIKIYPLWILCCVIYAWSAWTRNSLGIMVNSILVATVDLFGLTRLLLQGI